MILDKKRHRESDRSQDDIIDAANRLFFQKGFEGVSMDEIAKEVGLNTSTLYFHFKDKESLYIAIVNHGIKIFRLIIEETEGFTMTNNLDACVIHRAFNRFIQKHPDYARAYIYFRSGHFKLSNNKITNGNVKEILEFTDELIERATQETKTCKDNGIFRPDVNYAILTAFYFLINESFLTMNKDLKNILEAQGITLQQFYLTVSNLAGLNYGQRS